MVLLPRNVPAATFGRSQAAPRRNETPGPGQYSGRPVGASAGLLRQKPNSAFGVGPQREEVSAERLGPRRDPAWQVRVALGEGFVPGPGTYEPKKLERGKSSAFRARRNMLEADRVPNADVPGPGAYPEKPQAEGLAATMKLPLRQLFNDNPGPGEYNPVTPHSARVRRGFGSTRRVLFRTDDIPGPGSYSKGPAVWAPAVEKDDMRATFNKDNRRLNSWMSGNTNPGPAHFSMTDTWGRKDGFAPTHCYSPGTSPAAAMTGETPAW